jgi:hypothetical protein
MFAETGGRGVSVFKFTCKTCGGTVTHCEAGSVECPLCHPGENTHYIYAVDMVEAPTRDELHHELATALQAMLTASVLARPAEMARARAMAVDALAKCRIT